MLTPEFATITTKVLFILLIGWVTRKRFTFTGAISNGVLILLSGGTLLWGGFLVGYFFLVYGAFLMIAGMKEEELLKLTGRTERLGLIIQYVGHYLTAAVILEAAALYCFWPF